LRDFLETNCDHLVIILGAARLSDAASVAYAQVSHQVWPQRNPFAAGIYALGIKVPAVEKIEYRW